MVLVVHLCVVFSYESSSGALSAMCSLSLNRLEKSITVVKPMSASWPWVARSTLCLLHSCWRGSSNLLMRSVSACGSVAGSSSPLLSSIAVML